MNEILIVGLLSYESPKYWGLCSQCLDFTRSDDTEIFYAIGLDRVSKAKEQELYEVMPLARGGIMTYDVSIAPGKKKETTHQKRVRIGQLYNNIFELMPKSFRYVFSLDCDIAITKPGWDKMFMDELHDQYVVIGHGYGSRWAEKYQGFPCLQCSFFDWNKVGTLKFDFRGSGEKLKIRTEQDAKNFGLKVGAKLNRDIGWECPKVIREAGFDGKEMGFIPGNHKDSEILTPRCPSDKKIYKKNIKDNIKSLFEIRWKGESVGTHLTKSTCLEYNKHPISKYWVARVKSCIGK